MVERAHSQLPGVLVRCDVQAVRQSEHLALLKLLDNKQQEEHKKQRDNLQKMLQVGFALIYGWAGTLFHVQFCLTKDGASALLAIGMCSMDAALI